MQLSKEDEKLVIDEVLNKLEYGRSFKKYRDLEDGCKVWRRGYLRTYKDSSPSYRRDREQKYYLGLIFRTIEQFAADAKDALFSNSPFFTLRPRGSNPSNSALAEATQAVMEYNTTIPIDYSIQFLAAYRHALTFGVSYIAPFYDYREMYKTNYSQYIDIKTGQRKYSITDELEAECDHPDFDVIYPTRAVCDPNAKFGKFERTCDWRIIERIRPYIWYLDKQELYGYSDKIKRAIRDIQSSNFMTTTGPDNFSNNWSYQESKQINELEYVGRIQDPRLKSKFNNKRRYIVTILNQELVARCDICTAPDGIGLHAMSIIPDIDGSHIGIGIADPSVDYQRAINEWYNLRMRGLGMAINPAWLVDQSVLPNWKQMENHPPGKMFPYSGGADARKVIQPLMPADVNGSTWEQMVDFTQRDYDMTAGSSSSRLGSIEGERRTATELSQVKEGADRRSNTLIYHAVRTGHKPTLWSMIMYTLNYWNTPRILTVTDQRTLQQYSVMVTPQDIKNAQVELDVVDNTGGSIDQSMAFYAKMYELSLQDPSINRTATLINMLKNSRIVNDPYSLIAVDPMGIQRNMAFNAMSNPNTEKLNDKSYREMERGTNTDISKSSNRIPTKFRV